MKKDTKIKISIIVLIVLTALLAASYDLWSQSNMTLVEAEKHRGAAGSGSVLTMEKAPDFSFVTLRGEKRTLSDLREPVILLHFWASWCVPCIAEFPDLYELVSRYKGEIALLAVSMDEGPEDIEKFLARLEKTGKLSTDTPHIYLVWDKDLTLSRELFGVVKVPETIFIDQQRNMLDKMVGEVDWLGQGVAQILEKTQKKP